MDSVQIGTSVPGIRTARTYTPREVLWSKEGARYLPAGRVIDGTASRDPLNTGDISTLRPGMIMGKITATGKYANSIIGKTTVATASAATTVTVGTATAVEIVRRVGATGTLRLIGPPSAAGTVAVLSVTYSAVVTSTGVLTVTATTAAAVIDSPITANDGSGVGMAVLDNFVRVTDVDGNNLDAQGAKLLVSGIIDETQLLNWPADASTRTYILQNWLNVPYAGPGPFLAKGNF